MGDQAKTEKQSVVKIPQPLIKPFIEVVNAIAQPIQFDPAEAESSSAPLIKISPEQLRQKLVDIQGHLPIQPHSSAHQPEPDGILNADAADAEDQSAAPLLAAQEAKASSSSSSTSRSSSFPEELDSLIEREQVFPSAIDHFLLHYAQEILDFRKNEELQSGVLYKLLCLSIESNENFNSIQEKLDQLASADAKALDDQKTIKTIYLQQLIDRLSVDQILDLLHLAHDKNNKDFLEAFQLPIINLVSSKILETQLTEIDQNNKNRLFQESYALLASLYPTSRAAEGLPDEPITTKLLRQARVLAKSGLKQQQQPLQTILAILAERLPRREFDKVKNNPKLQKKALATLITRDRLKQAALITCDQLKQKLENQLSLRTITRAELRRKPAEEASKFLVELTKSIAELYPHARYDKPYQFKATLEKKFKDLTRDKFFGWNTFKKFDEQAVYDFITQISPICIIDLVKENLSLFGKIAKENRPRLFSNLIDKYEEVNKEPYRKGQTYVESLLTVLEKHPFKLDDSLMRKLLSAVVKTTRYQNDTLLKRFLNIIGNKKYLPENARTTLLNSLLSADHIQNNKDAIILLASQYPKWFSTHQNKVEFFNHLLKDPKWLSGNSLDDKTPTNLSAVIRLMKEVKYKPTTDQLIKMINADTTGEHLTFLTDQRTSWFHRWRKNWADCVFNNENGNADKNKFKLLNALFENAQRSIGIEPFHNHAVKAYDRLAKSWGEPLFAERSPISNSAPVGVGTHLPVLLQEDFKTAYELLKKPKDQWLKKDQDEFEKSVTRGRNIEIDINKTNRKQRGSPLASDEDGGLGSNSLAVETLIINLVEALGLDRDKATSLLYSFIHSEGISFLSTQVFPRKGLKTNTTPPVILTPIIANRGQTRQFFVDKTADNKIQIKLKTENVFSIDHDLSKLLTCYLVFTWNFNEGEFGSPSLQISFNREDIQQLLSQGYSTKQINAMYHEVLQWFNSNQANKQMAHYIDLSIARRASHSALTELTKAIKRFTARDTEEGWRDYIDGTLHDFFDILILNDPDLNQFSNVLRNASSQDILNFLVNIDKAYVTLPQNKEEAQKKLVQVYGKALEVYFHKQKNVDALTKIQTIINEPYTEQFTSETAYFCLYGILRFTKISSVPEGEESKRNKYIINTLRHLIRASSTLKLASENVENYLTVVCNRNKDFAHSFLLEDYRNKLVDNLFEIYKRYQLSLDSLEDISPARAELAKLLFLYNTLLDGHSLGSLSQEKMALIKKDPDFCLFLERLNQRKTIENTLNIEIPEPKESSNHDAARFLTQLTAKIPTTKLALNLGHTLVQLNHFLPLISLTTLRSSINTLFDQFRDVKTKCDVTLDGQALSATLLFAYLDRLNVLSNYPVLAPKMNWLREKTSELTNPLEKKEPKDYVVYRDRLNSLYAEILFLERLNNAPQEDRLPIIQAFLSKLKSYFQQSAGEGSSGEEAPSSLRRGDDDRHLPRILMIKNTYDDLNYLREIQYLRQNLNLTDTEKLALKETYRSMFDETLESFSPASPINDDDLELIAAIDSEFETSHHQRYMDLQLFHQGVADERAQRSENIPEPSVLNPEVQAQQAAKEWILSLNSDFLKKENFLRYVPSNFNFTGISDSSREQKVAFDQFLLNAYSYLLTFNPEDKRFSPKIIATALINIFCRLIEAEVESSVLFDRTDYNALLNEKLGRRSNPLPDDGDDAPFQKHKENLINHIHILLRGAAEKEAESPGDTQRNLLEQFDEADDDLIDEDKNWEPLTPRGQPRTGYEESDEHPGELVKIEISSDEHPEELVKIKISEKQEQEDQAALTETEEKLRNLSRDPHELKLLQSAAQAAREQGFLGGNRGPRPASSTSTHVSPPPTPRSAGSSPRAP